jgi:hypothetical protein
LGPINHVERYNYENRQLTLTASAAGCQGMFTLSEVPNLPMEFTEIPNLPMEFIGTTNLPMEFIKMPNLN